MSKSQLLADKEDMKRFVVCAAVKELQNFSCDKEAIDFSDFACREGRQVNLCRV